MLHYNELERKAGYALTISDATMGAWLSTALVLNSGLDFVVGLQVRTESPYPALRGLRRKASFHRLASF